VALIPMAWLQEFAPWARASEAVEGLTRAGVEVEAVVGVGAYSKEVVVGRVEAVSPAANLTSARRLEVDVGAPERLQVLSEAPGVEDVTGRLVAIALPGARLFTRSGDELCDAQGHAPYDAVAPSARELGIGADASGLTILSAGTPGACVHGVLPPRSEHTADDVLDIAILPNIARCFAVRGVAKELAAIARQPFEEHTAPADGPKSPMAPDRFEPGLARRFTTALLDGVEVMPSPEWLRRRLVLAGLRPVNNVVDASNYVMVELGQPTHAYDADQLSGALGVRRAREGERLGLLGQPTDETAPPLPAGVPVVVCGDRPVALAGMLGGAETAVASTTRRLRVEAAAFDPEAVRRAQAVLKLRTEASARLSRGVDPALTRRALERVADLLRLTCPDLRVVEIEDLSQGDEDVVRTILLPNDAVSSALGLQVPLVDVTGCLRALGLNVRPRETCLEVSVTSAREDLQGPHDLIEEVARLRGFDDIPATLPSTTPPVLKAASRRARVSRVRRALVAAGLQEVLTYSMTSPDLEARLRGPTAQAVDFVRLLNPHSVGRAVMRRSLLPEMLQVSALNLRRAPAAHLFEIGTVFHPEATGPSLDLPAQPLEVALVMAGPIDPATLHDPAPRAAGYFDVLGAAHRVFADLGLEPPRAQPATIAGYHPYAAAELYLKGRRVGRGGLVHPDALDAFDIRLATAAIELDVEALLDAPAPTQAVREPSRFQDIRVDLSVVVDAGLPAGELVDEVWRLGISELRDVMIFDDFRGPSVGSGRRALGLRLILEDPARTLTMDEGRAVLARVAEAIQARFAATVRG
jgi:phenylalanyl-tRNA synthetase beta chain